MFPPPFELQAIKHNWAAILASLRELDIANYSWHPGRRFVVPKDELAFRTATQLDPIDSLILAAIVHKYGARIEAARVSPEENRVFSYRLDPLPDGHLYGETSGWQTFWRTSLSKAERRSTRLIAVVDVTDYYNQIYHHTLENELVSCGIPGPVKTVLFNLLGGLTHKMSRGIPVGPHYTHLLAECAFGPIDRSLLAHGHDFCRYVDDVHFFCTSKERAEIAIYDFAEIIDKQQRLTLQNQKTEVVPAEDFVERARHMVVDQPLNDEEAEILELIKEYSGNNPYATITLDDLSEEDLAKVDQDTLTSLLNLYMGNEPRNYARIGWLLRRFSQIGAPGSVDYVLKHIGDLTPILGNVAQYVMKASPNYEGDIERNGRLVVRALRSPVVKHSPYIQVVLLNLFAWVPALDHVDRLTAMYSDISPEAQREVVVAVGNADQGHWVRERKDEFVRASTWMRCALLYAARSLPGDEGVSWVRQLRRDLTALEHAIVHWAFGKEPVQPGRIRI